MAPATDSLQGWGLDPPQVSLNPPPPAWQVLRMTIHGLDGEGTPQHLSMSKKERTGTFAVRDGLNASVVVVYDYSKVGGAAPGTGGSGDRAELTPICLQTAAGQLQVLASPRLLRHPRGQGHIPGLDAVTETFQRRQVGAGHPSWMGLVVPGPSVGLLGLWQAWPRMVARSVLSPTG